MNWPRLKHSVMFLNVVVFLIAGYLYFIDGTFIRQPVVYQSDPLNIRLEKTVYRPGDVLRAYISFCKTYQIKATTIWTMVDGQLTIFSPVVGDAGPSCHTDALFDIGIIPSYVQPETAHVEGTAEYNVNPLHTVIIKLRTQDFTISS